MTLIEYSGDYRLSSGNVHHPLRYRQVPRILSHPMGLTSPGRSIEGITVSQRAPTAGWSSAVVLGHQHLPRMPSVSCG